MTAVALALASALSWGTADFVGGLKARVLPALGVVLISQAVALAGAGAWVLTTGTGAPPGGDLLLAAIGGAAGALALTCFYQALAIGTMSIVAPVSATGAIVPVSAGLIGGESPGVLQFAGMLAAFVGVLLASREGGEEVAKDARRSVLLALVAAAGFGTFLWLLDPASEESIPWALLAARTASVTCLLLAVAPRLGLVRPAFGGRHLAPLALIGTLDLAANALYAIALEDGLLSVISVLGSLYPAATVVLATLILRERIRRSQTVGVATVLLGVGLIAAG